MVVPCARQAFAGFTGPLRLIDLRWTKIKTDGLQVLYKALKENEVKHDEDIELRGIPTRRQLISD